MKPQNKKTLKDLPKANPLAMPKPNLRKRYMIIAVFVVLVLGVSGWLVYRNHKAEQAYQADKARFAQVEKDMAAAYAAMTAGDKPAKEELHKGCSRISLKYAQGDLSCAVTYEFVYGSGGYEESLIKAKATINSLYGTTFNAEDLDKIENAKATNNEQSVNMRVLQSDSLSCDVSLHVYKTGKFNFEYLSTPRASEFFFTCRQNMTRPIYTLAE